MSNKSPCEPDCPKRGPTCHAKCKEYTTWQQNHFKELERQREQKKVDAALAEMSRGWERRRR